jgi:hypothetical protein
VSEQIQDAATVPRPAPEPKERQEMILRLACAAIAMFSVMTLAFAQAASPAPQPTVDLGETSLLDGEAGPGALFEVIGNCYVASQFTDASGRRVAGTDKQSIGTVIFHLAYVSNLPVAGGVLGAEALVPFSALHLNVPSVRRIRSRYRILPPQIAKIAQNRSEIG